MENNNGRSVFYGVIGVATLIVAIIGATFAYFSASANSANNAASAGATVLSLDIDSVTDNLRTEMIPVETNGKVKATEDADETTDDTDAGLDAAAFPTVVKAVANDPETQDVDESKELCKDLLNNNICSVYTFTVTNPSESASQQIYGYLTVKKNEFANLKYAVYKGEPTDITSWTVNGTDPTADTFTGNFDISTGGVVQHVQAVPTSPISAASTDNDIPGMTVTLAPEESVTYTILFWIEETGQDQTDTDSKITDGAETRGRIFEGGVLVNTSGGGSGVTATLRLA